MKLPKFKKVLFIENESWDDMENHPIWLVEIELKKRGTETIIIEQAKNHKQEVFQIANDSKTEAIFFASTFTYQEDIKSVGNLLMKIKEPKMIFGCHSAYDSLQGEIETIWSLEELKDFSHHRLFSFSYSHTIDEKHWAEEIDLKEYKKQWEKKLEALGNNKENYKKTGAKILIKDILGHSPQFVSLKKGMIVEELDCSQIDTQPYRGVWVMGVDEPIKLLNDNQYDEWEYDNENLTALQLTREFFSMGNKMDKKDLMETIESWIRRAAPKLDEIELEKWYKELCKITGLPCNTHNVNYFKERLKIYRDKHQFFLET